MASWSRRLLVVSLVLAGCTNDVPLQRRTLAVSQQGFAAFAYQELSVDNHANVTGALGVRDNNTGPAFELIVGPYASLTSDLFADKIQLQHHSSVTGAITGNDFSIHSTVTLSQQPSSPLALPLPDLTPSIPLAQPGTQNVDLSSGSTLTLSPGAYGTIFVRSGSSTTLSLSGGLYQFQSLELGPYSHVVCLSACEIRIATSLTAAHHSAIGASSNAAGDLLVSVDGSTVHVGQIGEYASFTGRLIAKSRDVQISNHAVVRGQVIGQSINVGPYASLTVEAPFGQPASDAGVPLDAGIPDAPRQDAPLPDAPAPQPDAPAADVSRPDLPVPDVALPDVPRPDTVSCTSVGSAGGTVASADGKAVLEVPAAALSSAVCISIRPATGQPSGNLDTAYVVEPAGTTFSTPAMLRLSFDPAQLGGVAEATLALAKVSGSAWQVLAGSAVDASNDKVSAPIVETGSFGVVPSVCGDGVVSGTEACDGSVPPGVTCQSLGFVGGTLACTACAIDTSGCVSCVPTTCAALGKNCGTVPDGCGGTLDCGTCAAPQTCGGGGVANVCGCTPSTCAALGATCGSIADGCGGTLDCGSCTLPETCVANHCVCTPTTCAAQLAECGTIPDGCGGSLDCGSCLAPAACGGGGVPNACGCTPTTCAALGASCGSVPDGCGGTLECGTCTLPQICGGGGTPNQCGCTPTTCAAQGKDCGSISDGCGGQLDCGTCGAGLLCGWGGALNVCGAAYPPDPASVAPPIQEGVATTIVDGYGFLYQGSSPIQVNVAPSAIETVRASIVRGRVLDAAGSPRPGVTVDILGQPALGHTLTRSDGRFDLVVNGGAPIVVRFAATGLLSAQRQVSVLWQDQVTVDDVVLIAPDSQVTTIQSGSASMQVARGSISNDSSGPRQATLLFPAGTSATMTLPDGSTQPLPTMNVRATEFTLGTLGPKRMPAELPPNVAYTYAVELNADEAVAGGAERVNFSNPVVFYTENFLGFPVGQVVPLGWYDLKRAVWVPAASGRIVKVLSVTAGLADLDLVGSGLPADAAALTALGITDDERARLGTLYVAGQSLWRMPIPHLSFWDANWPWDGPTPSGPGSAPSGPPVNPPTTCTWPIECQTQTLQERAAVTGTPFTLHYRSDRVPGRADGVLEIPLTSATPPAGLQRVELEVHVAGRVFKQTFPPTPSQSASFTWDGLDSYGRPVRGKQQARVRLGYFLVQQYGGGGVFGGPPSGGTGVLVRVPREFWFYSNVLVGHLDTPRSDLGGWSLSAVHTYDPGGRDLYLGDGRKQRGDETFSHAVSPVYERGLSTDVAVDGEGNLYMSLAIPGIAGGSQVVMKRSRNGVITRFAGQEGFYSGGFSGDGGPAVNAQLALPMGVAVDTSGNLFIADRGNGRVRRIDKVTGVITTVAGGGPGVGEGGPATSAAIDPYRVAVDRHGTLYIADRYGYRIRRVDTDGRIWTVAGTGVDGYTGDGGPATSAQINRPDDLDVDDRGQIYFSASAHIRKIGPDGIITTIARNQGGCSMAEGVPLSQACIIPLGVAVDRKGDLHFTDASISMSRSRIRRVNEDGTVTTIAGGGLQPASGMPGVPAMRAQFCPGHIAFAPDGTVYSAAESNDIVNAWGCWEGFFRVAPAMPGFTASEIAVPSSDGGELYRFSESGRHLETKSSLTGATLATIGYTTDGKLASVTDGDGNVTTVQRSASGAPAAIVGPYGQSTTLSLDANGWLGSVTNPASETKQFGYTADGLMTSALTPRGHGYSYTYGSYGRIESHTGPDTATKTLALNRTSDDVYNVRVTSGEGKTTVYGVEGLASGGVSQQNTFPSGLASSSSFQTDATSSVTLPDGTVTTTSLAPDPRWRMVAPYTSASSTRMPSTLTHSQSAARAVTLADPNNPLSLTQHTDTFVQNGKTTTTVYTGPTRLETTTSPMGRVTKRWIDAQGRTTRVEVAGQAPVVHAYDAKGRLASTTQGTAPETRVTTMTYDPQSGFLASITDPLSRTTSFLHDAAGRVTEQSLPGGRTVLMGYDPNGNLVSIQPPGRTAHLFGFTPVDETASYTPPDLGLGSPTTSYQYNLDRQLAKVTRPDGQVIEMGYDTAGRLGTITTPTGVTTYTYSPTTGTLSSVAAPGGVGLAYSWDGSLPTGTTWSGPVAGSVTRTYNNDFDVASITIAGSTPFTFTRDNDRLLTGAGAMTIARDATTGFVTGTTLGSVTTGRTYSSFGELATTSASAGSTPLFATSYTRDALGRITELVETIEGVTATWGYDYNAAGQLWRVRLDGVQVAEYHFDPNGNRTSATDVEIGVTTTAAYDAQDRLSTYGSTSYSYTLNGELQSKTVPGVGTTTFSYDVLGNLRGASLADGTAIEYVIDGENRRIGKKVGGALVQGWLWDGELRVVAELDGAGAVVSRFVYAEGVNVPAYIIKGTTTYRIITDHLGSPRLVVDVATGAVVQRIDYDEWGRVIADSAPGFQPFGFAGGIYDQHTQLVRFGARDYDPETGRWTSKDPILTNADESALYAYSTNDPINSIDPEGRQGPAAAWLGAIPAGIGGGLGMAANACWQSPTCQSMVQVAAFYLASLAAIEAIKCRSREVECTAEADKAFRACVTTARARHPLNALTPEPAKVCVKLWIMIYQKCMVRKRAN